MLLVDSLYINVGGGKALLDYLVKELETHQIDVFYLFDLRCKDDFKEVPDKRKLFLKAGLFSRYDFYKKNRNKLSKVFCFGNIPPPCKLENVLVYTYFHNVLMFNERNEYSTGLKVKVYLRNKLLKYLKKNTNIWIVQSKLVKEKLIKYLNININDCVVVPFFDLSNYNEVKPKKENKYIYVGSGATHKNTNRLLDAWSLVYKKGFEPELHLTIPQYEKDLINKIEELVEEGIKIINHGFLEKSKLSLLYAQSQYLIYPSLFESFGLPLLEAIEYECKVIAADLEYTYEVIEPSYVFNPYNSKSIADAVIFSLKNELMPSKAKVKNEIDQILKMLS